MGPKIRLLSATFPPEVLENIETALKTSKLYQNNAVQVIGGDRFATDNFKMTGKYPEQVNFTFLSTKGGYSRAVNREHPKVAVLPLVPTYPGIMYSESETEDERHRDE